MAYYISVHHANVIDHVYIYTTCARVSVHHVDVIVRVYVYRTCARASVHQANVMAHAYVYITCARVPFHHANVIARAHAYTTCARLYVHCSNANTSVCPNRLFHGCMSVLICSKFGVNQYINCTIPSQYFNISPPQCPQAEVFNECVVPLLETFLEGYNATILAYGQVCMRLRVCDTSWRDTMPPSPPMARCVCACVCVTTSGIKAIFQHIN